MPKELLAQVEIHWPWWLKPALVAYCLILWIGLQAGLINSDQMCRRLDGAIGSLVRRHVRVGIPKIV